MVPILLNGDNCKEVQRMVLLATANLWFLASMLLSLLLATHYSPLLLATLLAACHQLLAP